MARKTFDIPQTENIRELIRLVNDRLRRLDVSVSAIAAGNSATSDGPDPEAPGYPETGGRVGP